jgi:dTDP-4-dehydrorhamnose 3,5-epimerase
MSLPIVPLEIPGCFEIRAAISADSRGNFVKTFHRDQFAEAGLCVNFAEEYHSYSKEHVLRGLHFQTPPVEHVKQVFCVTGKILDVGLDLRVGSPSYGKHLMIELSAESGNMVYLAPGIAHGFYVPSGSAIVAYRTSTVYSRMHDAGIRWNSAGIPWPNSQPIMSIRDTTFPAWGAFESPFRYGDETLVGQ